MATKQQNNRSKPKRPVHEIRLGRIVAAIWEHNTQYGLRHHVSVSRIYRNEDGTWARSSSFDRDGLLVAAKALDLAHSWICEQAQSQNDEARSEEDEHGEVPY